MINFFLIFKLQSKGDATKNVLSEEYTIFTINVHLSTIIVTVFLIVTIIVDKCTLIVKMVDSCTIVLVVASPYYNHLLNFKGNFGVIDKCDGKNRHFLVYFL
jgi:hypothetical protein